MIVVDGTDVHVLERPGIVVEGAALAVESRLGDEDAGRGDPPEVAERGGGAEAHGLTVSVSTSRKWGSTEKVCGRGSTPRAKNRGTPSRRDMLTKAPAAAGPAAAMPATRSAEASRCEPSISEHADLSSISPSSSWPATSRSSSSPSTSLSADEDVFDDLLHLGGGGASHVLPPRLRLSPRGARSTVH